MNDFAKNFKKYRLLNEFSQIELANLLNIRQQTISEWENGRNKPSVDQLLRICELFNITPNQILGYANFKTQEKREIKKIV